MAEQMALIKNVGYGNRDVGKPCLWFETYISEGTAALQVLIGEEADWVIKDAGVYEVYDLNGRACLVDVDGARITFQRVLKI